MRGCSVAFYVYSGKIVVFAQVPAEGVLRRLVTNYHRLL